VVDPQNESINPVLELVTPVVEEPKKVVNAPEAQDKPRAKGRKKKKVAVSEKSVWLPLSSVAELVGLSVDGLRKRVLKTKFPEGTTRRWGRSVFFHRERFLAWMDEGGKA
jgi:hypothetical protein